MNRQVSKISIVDHLSQKALEDSIVKRLDEKAKADKAKPEKKAIPKKWDSVELQLQILHFLGALHVTSETKLEDVGYFYGVLLNRHPQRARKPFSSINNLLYSSDKTKAKNIRKNLMIAKELFEKMKMKDEQKKVLQAIKKIDQKHFPENL